MGKWARMAALSLGCALPWQLPAVAQSGAWPRPGGDAQLSGWQKHETRITRETGARMRLLWKLRLAPPPGEEEWDPMPRPTEPLVAGRLITEGCFRDEAVVLGRGDMLYGVDFALGRLMWEKHFDVQWGRVQTCPEGQFSAAVIQPPPTFRYRPGAPRKPANPPPPETTARVGGTIGRSGGFRKRGVFVITRDGYLHEQILANGADFGTPVKFLAAANEDIGDLGMSGGTVYVTTSRSCGGRMQADGNWQAAPNGAWALDVSTSDYRRAGYDAGATGIGGLAGAAESTDGGTLYAASADGAVALDAQTLGAKDYYTPSTTGSNRSEGNVSPVVFAFGGRDLVAVYDADGRLVLLDGASLGGAEHHTPLAATVPLAQGGANGAWGRLASAEVNGRRWIFAAIQGPRAGGAHFPVTHGATPDGCIAAFQVEEHDGRVVLSPGWVSANVADPSPAVIASGMVFSLANGMHGRNAKLFAFDAATGGTVFTSRDQVRAPGYFSSLSLSLGHILFVTADDTLYSFGIGIEH